MLMLVVLTSLIFLLPAVVAAQEEAAPRATIFGGYSYLRNSGSSSFNGWEGQGTFNFSRHFGITADINGRSEEHTSELQSRVDLVCRLLLEKKKIKRKNGALRSVRLVRHSLLPVVAEAGAHDTLSSRCR